MSKAAAPGAGVLDAALSSVDAALQAANDERRAELDAANRKRADLHHEYLSVLCRSQSPEPGDAGRLTTLILELGLSTSDVRRDSNRIAEAEKKLAVIAGRTECRAARDAASEAHEATKERHKRELQESQSAYDRANAEFRKLGWLEKDISELHRDSPELFATGLLVLPEVIAARFAKQVDKPDYVPHCGPKMTRQINGRWVEPVIGEDGEYKRDARGQYIFPTKQFPEPLLDGQGKPVVDKYGQFVYPTPKVEPAVVP